MAPDKKEQGHYSGILFSLVYFRLMEIQALFCQKPVGIMLETLSYFKTEKDILSHLLCSAVGSSKWNRHKFLQNFKNG